jgi:hypothetical protein
MQWFLAIFDRHLVVFYRRLRTLVPQLGLSRGETLLTRKYVATERGIEKQRQSPIVAIDAGDISPAVDQATLRSSRPRIRFN